MSRVLCYCKEFQVIKGCTLCLFLSGVKRVIEDLYGDADILF